MHELEDGLQLFFSVVWEIFNQCAEIPYSTLNELVKNSIFILFMFEKI